MSGGLRSLDHCQKNEIEASIVISIKIIGTPQTIASNSNDKSNIYSSKVSNDSSY